MERLCSVCGWEILFRSRNINNIVCVLHTAGRKECFPALPVVFLVTKILINMSFHNRIVERKKWILLLLAAVDISVAYAQEEFRITGKANGLTDGTLLLLIDEGGQDTLATTLIKNGVFMFTGKVDSPSAAYIMISNGKEMIPLILENVPFTINLSEQGALIQGGEQQEIFGQFNRISNRLLREQGRIQQAYTRAEQARDKVGVKAAMKQFEEAIAVARAEEKALREKYPDLYVIAYVVALGMRGDTEDSLREKYEALGEVARGTAPGKEIAAMLDRYAALEMGKIAPDFTATKPDGNTFTLYGLPAKLKLIHFWSSENADSR